MISLIARHSPKAIRKVLEKNDETPFPLLRLPPPIVSEIISFVPLKSKLSLSLCCKQIHELNKPLLEADFIKIIQIRKSVLFLFRQLEKITPILIKTKAKIKKIRSLLEISRRGPNNESSISYIYPKRPDLPTHYLSIKNIKTKLPLKGTLSLVINFNPSFARQLITISGKKCPRKKFLKEMDLVLNFVAESSWRPPCDNLPGSKEFKQLNWTQSIPIFLQSKTLCETLEQMEELKMLPIKTHQLQQERFKILKIKA